MPSARLRRGSLIGEKIGAPWYVLLPAGGPGEQSPQRDTRQSRDATSRHTTRQGALPARDELIAELQRDKAYLPAALDRTLAQLADERETSDVLMREALGRIEDVTAGPVADVGEARHDAPQRT